MNSKPTWEDVPGMIAQILDILKGATPETGPEEKTDPAPVAEQTTAAVETDRETARGRILHINRSNPDRRSEVKAIIAQYTPTGDGRFDDVPDAKIADLLAHLEGAFNVAA